jgi:DNA sulfur modification protein DndD
VNKNLDSRNWILKGKGGVGEVFGDRYDKYEENKSRKKYKAEVREEVIDQIIEELPVNVPEPIFVKRMVDKEHCLVCNRPAPKGSPPYLELIKKLNSTKVEPNKKDSDRLFKHDFSSEFRRLYHKGLELNGSIKRIDQDIEDTFKGLNDLDVKIKTLKKELVLKQEELDRILGESSIGSVDSSVNITNSFQSHHKAIVEFQKKLDSIENKIALKERDLEEIEKELKGLSSGGISNVLEEKVEILTDFYDITRSTRKRVFGKLIKELEDEANKHFFNMTSGNKAFRGKIKLELQQNGKYMPKNYDNQGNPITAINDSNIILIKLAVIMAIISAKKSSPAASLYTLISDAPTSKFAENYAIGFCRVASRVYNQSIIMSKDFHNNPELERKLKKEVGDRLGMIYLIEPNLDSERVDRSELETIASRIK